VGERREVQRQPGLHVAEVDAEHPLGRGQPLVHRRPGHAEGLRGRRLAAVRGQPGAQRLHQFGAVFVVIGEQRAEFPLDVDQQPRVVPHQEQQAAHPDVRHLVVGPQRPVAGRPPRGLRHVECLAQRRARPVDAVGRHPGADYHPAERAEPGLQGPGQPAEGRVHGGRPLQRHDQPDGRVRQGRHQPGQAGVPAGPDGQFGGLRRLRRSRPAGPVRPPVPGAGGVQVDGHADQDPPPQRHAK
jgi:hypothetical protein